MVVDPLRELAARHGPRRALIDRTAGFWVSWSALDDLAQTWARRLEREGVCGGQRVAVVEPAGVRFAALLHACLRLGAAMVPISPRAPGAELERILADCRPRLLIREGEVEPLPDPASGPEGDACVLYTSGTTGPPKGVRLTLANLVASARGCAQVLEAGERDRWLLMLSPHHVGGFAMFLRSVVCDQALVTLARFEERAVLEAIAATRPTLTSVVPVMLERLIAAGGAEALRGLRAILVGGAPATPEQTRRWCDLGLKVCPTYGLTETASQVALVPPGRARELGGTAGVVCPHARIEVEEGEIVVGGPCLSPGYVNPALRPAPEGGRFRTGDLGRLRPDGCLEVLGRRDDVIITGGENVHPEEVEAVLRAHPAVADVAVAGRPDPVWGQVVTAWVVADGVAPAELEAWCRARLSPFKVPRRWRFVERLPRSEGGKLLRRALA
ncbi:MAG TPA: class I adenylate-forming enzyme family protein [Candidatus Dormibacteraeota bacterium]|nr:class I adenylate-forming enzyme family protein [Candidatus Dormibacteraeota bacterium]